MLYNMFKPPLFSWQGGHPELEKCSWVLLRYEPSYLPRELEVLASGALISRFFNRNRGGEEILHISVCMLVYHVDTHRCTPVGPTYYFKPRGHCAINDADLNIDEDSWSKEGFGRLMQFVWTKNESTFYDARAFPCLGQTPEIDMTPGNLTSYDGWVGYAPCQDTWPDYRDHNISEEDLAKLVELLK